MIVASTDGVELAVHDLGGHGPTLLVSHATGFHGRCYEPLAHALGDRVHSISFDYRGHGDTERPDGPIDWARYGDDAHAMATWLRARDGGPIDAFGHSMGGACLLMAALRDPSLFRRLVLFEPIVFPPDPARSTIPDDQNPMVMGARRRRATFPIDQNPMVMGARRRRATFPTFQAAIDNYAAKPPLNGFTADALRAYVLHGFAPDDDGVHLKCRPDTEAETFSMGPRHDTWERLPQIATEVLVIAGRVDAGQPSMIAAQIADRLPNGRYVQFDQLDHFGPMARPLLVADAIAEALA